MGNTASSSESSKRRSKSNEASATERAKRVIGDLNEELKKSVKKLDEDHPAAQLIDHVCGGYFDDDKYRHSRSASFYSEDVSEDGSRTVSEDDTYDDRSRRSKATDTKSVESASYMSQSDYDSDSRRHRGGRNVSFDTEEDSHKHTAEEPTTLLSKPLASSFAKRCYFTKAGIGKTTQHYEGLTLTGNVVLMLAAAMKLKGCPTICDEDLRRVEQTYPNQFSRLPDELLLSSGWRRISKYCHFSNKPIPDGVPFFHSKQRLHPSGGYYFLLAASVGMVRPLDVEPLTKDTLVLLETDFPTQCDATPSVLIRDPEQWVLVDKFCFFSGGPINTEEDVYYQADFDGNPIYMLAFLSPSLTPEELYKLGTDSAEPGLKSVTAVQEVESVYDLTERDFDDLKLYHLGPCRALPQYILQPTAWTKVLPPHFLSARQQAMVFAEEWEMRHGAPSSAQQPPALVPPQGADVVPQFPVSPESANGGQPQQVSPFFDGAPKDEDDAAEFQRQIEEEGAFGDTAAPMDEAIASRFPVSPPGSRKDKTEFMEADAPKMDPPDDEPPSLTKSEENGSFAEQARPKPEENGGLAEQPSPFENPVHLPEPFDPMQPFDPAQPSPFTQENADDAAPPHSYKDPTMKQPVAREPANFGEPISPAAFEDADESPAKAYFSGAADAVDAVATPDGERSADHGGYFSPEGDEDYYDPKRGSPEFDEDEYFASNADPSTPGHYPSQQRGEFHHPTYVETEPYSPSDQFSPQSQDLDTPQGHFPMTPPDEEDLYSREEKKYAMDEPDDPELEFQMSNESDKGNGEEDFIPIKRQGYRLSQTSPRSTESESVGEGSHQSSALRGAQEILKKNRRRRMEMAMKQSRPRDSPMKTYDEPNPASPRDEDSATTWESGSELTGSMISGSSVWSEGTSGDRSSRRALILQMAKARMKSNKESASQASVAPSTVRPSTRNSHIPSVPIDEETDTLTEGHPDLDIAADLD